MGSVPLLRPREVIKAFERLGWERARQRGSHIIMTKPGHLATLSIPDRPYVARGTFARPDCQGRNIFGRFSGYFGLTQMIFNQFCRATLPRRCA